jgi:hypothetical protein
MATSMLAILPFLPASGSLPAGSLSQGGVEHIRKGAEEGAAEALDFPVGAGVVRRKSHLAVCKNPVKKGR